MFSCAQSHYLYKGIRLTRMKISLESNTGSDQFMSQTGADELVQVLEDWGVSHVYGLPGDSIDTTVDGLRKK